MSTLSRELTYGKCTGFVIVTICCITYLKLERAKKITSKFMCIANMDFHYRTLSLTAWLSSEVFGNRVIIVLLLFVSFKPHSESLPKERCHGLGVRLTALLST